jgi:hypothetical protein
MAEIKIEKKKPMWPWIIGGLALLIILAVFLFSDNNSNQDMEPAYSEQQESDYGQTGGVTGQSNEKSSIDGEDDRQEDRVVVGEGVSNLQDTVVVTPDDNSRNAQNNGNRAVADYVNYVKSDMDKKDLDPAVINQAFTRLSEATSAKAEEVGYNSRNIQEARTTIDQIAADASDQAKADHIKRSAEIISRELEAIQLSRYPDLDDEVANLKKASESIDPNEVAMNQDDEIMEFFDESAELLDKMK